MLIAPGLCALAQIGALALPVTREPIPVRSPVQDGERITTQVCYPHLLWTRSSAKDPRGQAPRFRREAMRCVLAPRSKPEKIHVDSGLPMYLGGSLATGGVAWIRNATTLFLSTPGKPVRKVFESGESFRVLRTSPHSVLLSVRNGRAKRIELYNLRGGSLGTPKELDVDVSNWERRSPIAPALFNPDFWFASNPLTRLDTRTGKAMPLLKQQAHVSAVVGDLVFAFHDTTAFIIDLKKKPRDQPVTRCPAPSRIVHVSPLGILYAGPFGMRLWDPISGAKRELPVSSRTPPQIVRRDGRPWVLTIPATRSRRCELKWIDLDAKPLIQTIPGASQDRAALLAQAKTHKDPNARTSAARELGWFFHGRSRPELFAILKFAKERRDYGLLNGASFGLSVGGMREDAPVLEAQIREFPSAANADCLAVLGHPASLKFLRSAKARIPRSNASDLKGVRRAIEFLVERPVFESRMRVARADPVWRRN